jgi:hypothetical protein
LIFIKVLENSEGNLIGILRIEKETLQNLNLVIIKRKLYWAAAGLSAPSPPPAKPAHGGLFASIPAASALITNSVENPIFF